jgi:hypothetical protein
LSSKAEWESSSNLFAHCLLLSIIISFIHKVCVPETVFDYDSYVQTISHQRHNHKVSTTSTQVSFFTHSTFPFSVSHTFNILFFVVFIYSYFLSLLINFTDSHVNFKTNQNSGIILQLVINSLISNFHFKIKVNFFFLSFKIF